MNPFYKIAIDHVNANYISGWCYDRRRPCTPVRLQFRIDGRVLAETVADRMREDLHELGIHPTGRCGFEMVVEHVAVKQSASVIELTVPRAVLPLMRIDGRNGALDRFRGWRSSLRRLTTFRQRSRRILFMHIPKTAGTSFNTLAGALFARQGVRSHLELVDPARFAEFEEQCRYLSGHLRVGVWRTAFATDNADLVTIVREPYAQLHSHFKWLIATATSSRDHFFKQHNRVIHELGMRLASTDLSSPPALSRFVAGLDDIEAAFLDNMQTRYFLDESPRRTGPQDFDRACRHCRLFAMIGLTERYEDFVRRFAERYQLNVPPQPARLNRSTSPPLYDIGDRGNREALLPLVRYDLQLYERVRDAW